MRKNQALTNEQLEKKLSGRKCCDKEMNLVETHEENNKICSKYVCSKCQSSIFDYGEKPKKAIILTTEEYEDLLTDIRNIYQRRYR